MLLSSPRFNSATALNKNGQTAQQVAEKNSRRAAAMVIKQFVGTQEAH